MCMSHFTCSRGAFLMPVIHILYSNKCKGATLYEGVTVEHITTTNNRVSEVTTSHGDIKCDYFVICSGLVSTLQILVVEVNKIFSEATTIVLDFYFVIISTYKVIIDTRNTVTEKLTYIMVETWTQLNENIRPN